MGGSTEAALNVTYNDSEHFPFRDMHGKKVSETILELEDAEKQLGTELHPDYWEPTEGNAGHACNILLQWAKQYPDCTWQVN